MIQDAFWGILIPFLGTSLGAGCDILFEKVPARRHPACPHRLCRRSDGGGIGMELADPGYGAGRRSGQAGIFPGGGGFLAGHPVFAAAGPSHPASAPEQFAGRRPKSQLQRTTMMVLAVTLHNIPEGMAVAWSMPATLPELPRSPPPGRWHFPLALPSRTSRRDHYLHAPAGRRNEKRPGILGRRTVRHRRAIGQC